MHGKTSPVFYSTDKDTLLSGLPSPFLAARYHSLVISRDSFPEDELEVRPPLPPLPEVHIIHHHESF